MLQLPFSTKEINSAIGHVRKIRRWVGHYLSRSSKNKAAHSKGGETTKSLISGDLHSGSIQDVWAIISAGVASKLSKSVVSLALSDGNMLIYACSGTAINCQEGSGTIFLTSASLIEVRHEGNEVYAKKKLVAVGRDKYGGLIAKSVMVGSLNNSNRSEVCHDICVMTEDWEGGPLFDFDGKFVGMNMFLAMDTTFILPWMSILINFKHYLPTLQNRILKRLQNLKRVRDGERPGELSDCHPEVHRGGLNKEKVGYLNSMGYPKPPVNVLDDICSEVIKKVPCDIHQTVVALASFKEWKGRTIILTSASLVTEFGDRNKIDENLRIEVKLPNKQRRQGTLQHYSLHYNVALVTVNDMDFHARPANIQLGADCPPQVAALGRCFESGKIMAVCGRLVDWTGTLDCNFLMRSSCKTTKAGIGGPLIGLDGKVIGMNFYDKKIGTPYVPWDIILEILACFEKESSAAEVGNGSDPSGAPGWKIPGDGSVKLNRWPVPLPYWRPHDDVEEQEPPEGCEYQCTYIDGERWWYRTGSAKTFNLERIEFRCVDAARVLLLMKNLSINLTNPNFEAHGNEQMRELHHNQHPLGVTSKPCYQHPVAILSESEIPH
uniref:Uncharacterized protein n=1 Tax=Oryza punctata TaxID=4537 RepID=A0A0E0L6T5_ORYPU